MQHILKYKIYNVISYDTLNNNIGTLVFQNNFFFNMCVSILMKEKGNFLWHFKVQLSLTVITELTVMCSSQKKKKYFCIF